MAIPSRRPESDEELARPGDLHRRQRSRGQPVAEKGKIGLDDSRLPALRQPVTRQASAMMLVVANAIAVPVARQAGEAVQRLEGAEEGVFLGRRQLQQDAVDVEDDRTIH
ncbi:MAG: hypothetical protein U1E16_04545 [Hyphomicrobiales bacterium]